MRAASEPPAAAHCFAVLTSPVRGEACEAVLELRLGSDGAWATGRVCIWCKRQEVHSCGLSEVKEVAMGQRVSSGTATRYHLCLLYRNGEPMLLSTRTDLERREVRRRSEPSARAPSRVPRSRVAAAVAKI
jgi:hypothetical protein